MIERVKPFLNLIENDDEQCLEQVRMYWFIMIGLLGAGSSLIGVILANNTKWQAFLFLGLVLCIVCFLLNRQQQITKAKFLMLSSVFVIVTSLIMVSQYGIRDFIINAYVPIIIAAGLLLDIRGATTFMILSIIAIWGIFYLQSHTYIADPTLSAINAGDMVILSVEILAASMFSIVGIRDLNRTVQQIYGQEHILLKSNQALEDLRSMLEETVQERTLQAEHARVEAEIAQAEMAQQIWLTTGQSQLVDAMRGNQSVDDLATNVIQQICVYLQIPLGSLFVMEEETLVFTSGYNFAPETINRRFGLGEGLIGDVARRQRPFCLDISHKPYQIVSDNSNISIQQILVHPFFYDGAVIGVLELGHEHSFTEQQLTFLQTITESVGIAFHTAYTHSQINTLLQELA